MKILKRCLALVGTPILLAMGAACDRNASQVDLPLNEAVEKSLPQRVDVTEAARLIDAREVAILDVRTPEEFSAGHIAGATNLNFHDRDFQVKLQQLDKNQPYLVHCAVGGRSARASATLKRLGFKSIYDFTGGMNAWEKASRPIAK